jgi:hypothetical protein
VGLGGGVGNGGMRKEGKILSKLNILLEVYLKE